jgi:hypothetical protein
VRRQHDLLFWRSKKQFFGNSRRVLKKALVMSGKKIQHFYLASPLEAPRRKLFPRHAA